jgi:hypothetical protein
MSKIETRNGVPPMWPPHPAHRRASASPKIVGMRIPRYWLPRNVLLAINPQTVCGRSIAH